VILVTGAIASGKKTYARSLGYEEEDLADATLDERPVVFNVQDMVALTSDLDELLEGLIAKDVVIMTEVGSGVVPRDSSERAWREEVGRLAIELGQRADVVVRMVCGIPVAVKGELPEPRA
jgi:adenosylcobinamide kinase/adenosylcobinamide-phosphate guanylyltransferase